MGGSAGPWPWRSGRRRSRRRRARGAPRRCTGDGGCPGRHWRTREARRRQHIRLLAARHGHAAAYHGIRLPKYAAETALRSTVGFFRVLGRLVSWWHVPGMLLLESQAAADGQVHDHLRLHRAGKETRVSRAMPAWSPSSACLAPWWRCGPGGCGRWCSRPPCSRSATPGGPRAIVQAAEVPAAVLAPTQDVIIRALGLSRSSNRGRHGPCWRCRGNKHVQRLGSRTVHRLARAIRGEVGRARVRRAEQKAADRAAHPASSPTATTEGRSCPRRSSVNCPRSGHGPGIGLVVLVVIAGLCAAAIRSAAPAIESAARTALEVVKIAVITLASAGGLAGLGYLVHRQRVATPSQPRHARPYPGIPPPSSGPLRLSPRRRVGRSKRRARAWPTSRPSRPTTVTT
jgi:hypothetical protein